MKKYILMILTAGLAVGVVSAQEGPGPRKEERKDRMEAKAGVRAELKDNRLEAKAEFKADMTDLRGDRKDMRADFKEWRQVATRTKEEIKERRQGIKMMIKDRRADIRAKLASSTKEIKARFDQNKKERVKQRIANVSGKFEAALARIDAFDAKVEEAVNRFKGRGLDVSNAEELLDAARESLTEVKKDAAAFKTKAQGIVDGDEVSRLALREEAEVVMQGIKATHAAYVDVIVELKASGGHADDEDDVDDNDDDDDNATSTATSTN